MIFPMFSEMMRERVCAGRAGGGLSQVLWQSFLNLIFPLHCVICNEALEPDNKTFLCTRCFRKIRFLREPFCEKCGRPNSIGLCTRCKTKPPNYTTARAAAIYEGVVRGCIHKFKYYRRAYLGESLGRLMVENLMEFPLACGCDLIVSVPLYRGRERERGFNQAFLLAKVIGKFLNMKVSGRNLVRIGAGKAQTELSAKERFRNVSGIFGVKDGAEFRGRSILLIDDVFTTGSTADECSRVLIEAGAGDVHILTVARGE